MLRCRLILEEYGTGIEYIPVNKNIAADGVSKFPTNINQYNTHESTYTTEIISGIYEIKELADGMFPLSFKLVILCQQ